MNLAGVHLDGRAFLAPMAGVTDSPYRILCKEYGAAVVYTEMTNAQGLARGASQTLRYLPFEEEERPLAIQIYGSDPATMESAAIEAMNWRPDFIDINLGCPVRKVVRSGAGSALLKDLPQLEKIVRLVVGASDIPVTAKIRSGWDRKHINAVEVAKLLEDSGVVAVAVHPRTRADQFTGQADWKVIAEVKEAVSITVIGNGDVFMPEDAERLMSETGCDAVMVGRGAVGRPWIFAHINHYLETGKMQDEPSTQLRFQLIDRFIDMEVANRGDVFAIYQIRRMLPWFLSGMPRKNGALEKMMSITVLDELRDTISGYSELVEDYDQPGHWSMDIIEEVLPVETDTEISNA